MDELIRLPLPRSTAVEDALDVHRVVDRLADAPVGERPALDLGDAEVDDAAARHLLDPDALGGGERLELVGRDVDDQVGLARLERRDPRAKLGDGPPRRPAHRRLAAPVRVVGLDHDAVVLGPLDELERARTHGLEVGLHVADLRHVLGRELVHEGHARRHRGVRHLGVEAHRVGIDDLHALDRAEPALLRRLEVRAVDALEGELDRIRVEGLAIVELHALAELDLPHLVAHELVRGRERGERAGAACRA